MSKKKKENDAYDGSMMVYIKSNRAGSDQGFSGRILIGPFPFWFAWTRDLLVWF